ncbi:hypothetical protein ACHAXT_007232 [Thalassiosira profunda]
MAPRLLPAAVIAALALSSGCHGASGPSTQSVELNEDFLGSKPDPSAVVCSRELNAFCPPNTKCCPRRRLSSSRSRRTAGSHDAEEGGDWGDEGEIIGYSCLLSWAPSRTPQGPCCDDSQDYSKSEEEELGTGCAAGYVCAAPVNSEEAASFLRDNGVDNLAQGPHCVRDDDARPVDRLGRPIENEYERMPRYKICPAFREEDIATPYGLPIPVAASRYAKGARVEGGAHDVHSSRIEEGEDGYMGQLAYFTNMGPLATDADAGSSSSHEGVTTAVVGIHGSGRDASSYLCAMIAAVADGPSLELEQKIEEQLEEMAGEFNMDSPEMSTVRRRRAQGRNKSAKQNGNEEDILVVAPWFLAPADGEPAPTSSLPYLKWVDKASIAHTFRYGAESIPNEMNGEGGEAPTISSYGAMDVLLETLCNKQNYPNLERIVVAGHSAGGQFVHRWGLTSDSWCFGDGGTNLPVGAAAKDLSSVRVVAANPRSYAYLDGRRYFPNGAEESAVLTDEDGEQAGTLSPFDELDFRSPTNAEMEDCPEFNRYCWGLDDNPDVPAPYITKNINNLSTDDGDNAHLFCRYASRDVVYLSGQRDIKQLGNQICDEDGYQGPSRRERSERFYASLQVRGEEIADNCRQHDAEEGRGFLAERSRYEQSFCERNANEGDVQVHDRLVVRNVGHDHALIFQSEEGRKGMFGDL